MITVYHNPRCSKSREACLWLTKKRKKYQVIEYLLSPPSKKELTQLVKMLDLKPDELIRKKEPLYIEKFADKNLTASQWIDVMVKNPVLIERPIVINGNKAVVARPAEKINEILK